MASLPHLSPLLPSQLCLISLSSISPLMMKIKIGAENLGAFYSFNYPLSHPSQTPKDKYLPTLLTSSSVPPHPFFHIPNFSPAFL